MNLFESMLSKKSQEVFKKTSDFISAFQKAKTSGKKPEKITVSELQYKTLMKDVEKYCKANNKCKPEQIKIDGVLICQR